MFTGAQNQQTNKANGQTDKQPSKRARKNKMKNKNEKQNVEKLKNTRRHTHTKNNLLQLKLFSSQIKLKSQARNKFASLFCSFFYFSPSSCSSSTSRSIS